MANLPDLDTDTIGVIAWFDVGVTILKNDIAPHLISFTEYDNGLVGVIGIDGITISVRVRTDGLIVAYTRRVDEGANGQYVEFGGWVRRSLFWRATGDGAAPFTAKGSTYLGYAIDAIENLVTTLGKTAVNLNTVNYYDFEFPTATNIYALINGTAPGNRTATFTVPSGQGIVIHAAGIQIRHSGGGSVINTSKLNGITLLSTNSSFRHTGIFYTQAGFAPLLQVQGTQNTSEVTTNFTNISWRVVNIYNLWVEEP